MESISYARGGIVVAVGSVVLICGLGACGSVDGDPAVDTDQDKPFILAGVANVTEVAQLTGPAAMNDTVSVGVAGTDLGSMVELGDRAFFLFGDTFGERADDAYGGEGGIWRSNVAAWTTDVDPSDGITFDGWAPTDGIGLAGAIIEGDHDGNDAGGEVTKIPTHGFVVDDALYVSYMSVRHWAEAGSWETNFAGLTVSTDRGETWAPIDGVSWPGDSNFIQVAAAPVTDADGDQIYFWSIPAGRFGEVMLMRVAADAEHVERQDAYSYFSGVDAAGHPIWSESMHDAEVIVEGTTGELSVMWSDYLQRWLMTYSDAGNAYIREGITPWGPWSERIEVLSGRDYPGLYAPYMSPRYVSDDGRTVFFTLSLWGPYNVFWFSLDLERGD